MKNKDNYEMLCDKFAEKFLSYDINFLLSSLCDIKSVSGGYIIKHFNNDYFINAKNGKISYLKSERTVDTTIRLNIYTYLDHVSPYNKLSGEWVKFSELKNASPFAWAFEKSVVNVFASAFNNNPAALKDAYKALGATHIEYSDMGCEIKAFESFPVRFLFWEKDEEFDAQANILFDRNSTDFIHVESVVTIASVGVRLLMEAAGLKL